LTIKVDFVIRTNIVYKKKNSWWPKSSMKASGSTMGLGLEITCGIVEDYVGPNSSHAPRNAEHHLQGQLCSGLSVQSFDRMGRAQNAGTQAQ
jgi:hypothetical protein